ncbi:MAG: hypothetical protein Ta2F_08060 [Termitinemataceae bacterium]|nr:MAG: hypothetical protein Ta2F_08060 [Termitinemataceae bacterium]
MLQSKACIIENIDEQYKKVAFGLFPQNEAKYITEDRGNDSFIEKIHAFADILGIGTEYLRIFNSKSDDPNFSKFLAQFQNNLDLLISKTWVEKCDEVRKEKLRARLPAFIALIKKTDYSCALEKFGEILEELAFLFFGKQSEEEDFIEYTLRIDTQMGLFWWYGTKIRTLQSNQSEKLIRSLLLIGLCYLTNF